MNEPNTIGRNGEAVATSVGLAGGDATHTPGPWKATGSSQNGLYFKVRGTQLAKKWSVANCPFTTDAYPGDKAEAEANARLIAAAPELFEFVLRLKQRMAPKMEFSGNDWKAICALVAKVTDEPANNSVVRNPPAPDN